MKRIDHPINPIDDLVLVLFELRDALIGFGQFVQRLVALGLKLIKPRARGLRCIWARIASARVADTRVASACSASNCAAIPVFSERRVWRTAFFFACCAISPILALRLFGRPAGLSGQTLSSTQHRSSQNVVQQTTANNCLSQSFLLQRTRDHLQAWGRGPWQPAKPGRQSLGGSSGSPASG